jgi:hypothetical protein
MIGAGVVVVIIIIAVAASSGGKKNGLSPASSSNPSSEDTSAPSSTVPSEHVGGTLSWTSNGSALADITLTKVEDPAQPGDSYTTPDPGKRFVAAAFTIKDTSTSQSITNEDANNDATLVGSDNQTYSADFDNMADCTNFSNGDIQLGPGETATGCVAFQIPDAVTVAKVRWAPSNGMGTNFGEWEVP